VLEALPETSLGPGLWVEVCVPYVGLQLENPSPRSPAIKELVMLGLPLRLYYSQVVWIDRIRVGEDGQVQYRVNEKYGSFGDLFWAAAQAFRPITAEEIAPINPEAEDKRVVVDLTYQTLSCFEGRQEVYFARVSTGVKFDGQGNPTEKSSTPLGNLTTWRKLISLHMSGGASGVGWDLSGVAWTNLFAGNGVAIHSTFWHNNFGSPMSRGCVNASPEDAKWVFRWTNPAVAYDPGDLTIQWPGGTKVEVLES
jgi:lipoprotein-anchoring transpeptidase ErfK/SrfK